MKKILMIGTGGTIASTKTASGLAPGLSSNELLSYIPQVRNVCSVDTIQVCNIDSTNVEVKHWHLISKTIEENYTDYDGFVIAHGTDTMAYTAAALSYMIQNSPKPIVLTGAQKSIAFESTDAKNNLLNSFIYASDNDSHDVCIVFDGKVILGSRAKKVQTKSFHAFESINYPYLAVMHDGEITRYFSLPRCADSLKFYHNMHKNVAILKMYPGIQPHIIRYFFEHYDGIVIESFGVGGIPQSVVDEFYIQMQKQSPKNCKLVVMTTQVANEGSNMTVYEVGVRVKRELDILEAFDMTIEATITKLMWLLPQIKGKSFSEIESVFYKKINNDIMYSVKQ